MQQHGARATSKDSPRNKRGCFEFNILPSFNVPPTISSPCNGLVSRLDLHSNLPTLFSATNHQMPISEVWHDATKQRVLLITPCPCSYVLLMSCYFPRMKKSFQNLHFTKRLSNPCLVHNCKRMCHSGYCINTTLPRNKLPICHTPCTTEES